MKIKHNSISCLLFLTLTISLTSACSLLKLQNSSKMTDEQYFSYLREDTSICEIPELKVKHTFFEILDTIILTKDNFRKFNSDPNPYVLSIEIINQNENLIYEINTVYTTLNLPYYYQGAFNYKNEIFVVSKTSKLTSDLYFDKIPKQIRIPFCDRIYHPKYNFNAKIKNGNIDFEWIENEIIKIK